MYREQEHHRYFTEADDAKVLQLMGTEKRRLTMAQWDQIAVQVGPGFTARKIQDRWYNFLRPPLDRSELTVTERRIAARGYLARPGEWRWIAAQLGDGKSRSSAMVKHAVANFQTKCQQVGLQVDRPEDVALLPDEAFQWGFPKGGAGATLVREYHARKKEADDRYSALRQQFSISALLESTTQGSLE
jgi:hypothetical protein